MANKSDTAYNMIVDVFKRTKSINQTISETGISKLTVQKVLITEGLWSSQRSREVLRLKEEGLSTEEIAERLHISIKGVQAYLPYSRRPYNTEETSDSIRSKRKRDKMKNAAANQISKSKTQTEKAPVGIEEVDMKIYEKPSAKEGDLAGKKKAPSVYKLRLELVQDEDGTPISLSAEDEELLCKYAKFKASFCREILVPAEMTLHGLHYAIQRLFGWQNSHLREFSLMPADFFALTNGETSTWGKLCGAYFRFPDEESMEQYWDDDYEGLQSFKTWLKQKYKGPYYAYGICDTYSENQKAVKELFSWLKEKRKTKEAEKLSDLTKIIWLGGDHNTLLERLHLSELLIPATMEKATAEDALTFVCDSIEEVKYSDSPDNFRYINSYDYLVRALCHREQKSQAVVEDFLQYRKKFEPAVIPFVNELIYRYDFGDGWCVKITCEEGYYFNDSFDTADGYVVLRSSEDRFLADRDYYRCADDGRVSDELNVILRQVDWKQYPVCVYADGLNLVDDVGGIYGYVDLIRTIYGEDKEEAKETLEWAEGLGWSKRMNKPDKML